MRVRYTLVVAVALAACDGSSPDGNARFTVRESVEQLAVTHAPPGATLDVWDTTGATIATGTVDMLGSLIFRQVPPAAGYTIHSTETPPQISRHLTVKSIADSQPAQDFYSKQSLQAGFGYITTRDGTTLSVYVTMPGDVSAGPYPTIVDYSGYSPSKPGEPVANGKYSFLCDSIPTLCNAPNDPSALIAALFGYATVSVNIRGTGCSGGAYDYFEPLELLDGYDVIETVAAQPWVLHNKVGMTGLSYPGITQLFVGKVRPPSLAAITPLSVIGNTATTLVPGGILNNGFALQWVTEVLDGADPNGQGWEMPKIMAGDTVCAENQLLHGQKINNVEEAKDSKFYTPSIIDPLNPTLFVDQINVPIFLGGSWQDDETGPFFTSMMGNFKSSPLVRMTVYNGVHPDGFQPAVLAEWKNFLDIYVAQTIPVTAKQIRGLAPILFTNIFNSSLKLPPDRLAGAASYADARKQYEADQPLRVIFESGASITDDPGAPGGTFEQGFSQWPPKETQPQRYYLHADGSLDSNMPTEAMAGSQFQLDPDAGQRSCLAPNGNAWDKQPAYDWQQSVVGKANTWITAPLATDQVFAGTGSADLWISSTENDADLQVTVSEVRPDNKEVYVQSGWLRASFRKLDTTSTTELWPSLTYHGTDAVPLVPGQWTQVRVPIAGFGHPFRAGSRIRITIDTPGGTRAQWRFQLKTFTNPVTHTIGHSTMYPSSIALPLLAGVKIPTPLPVCTALRGQPCRDYVPLMNTPAK